MGIAVALLVMGYALYINEGLHGWVRFIGAAFAIVGYFAIGIMHKQVVERVKFLEDARNLVITFTQKDSEDEEES